MLISDCSKNKKQARRGSDAEFHQENKRLKMQQLSLDVSTTLLPSEGVLYCWPRGFLVSTPSSFIIHRGDHPPRRPSMRLMLTLGAPFQIEFEDGTWLKTQAVLMAPTVKRRQTIALGGGFILLDIAVFTPEYTTLHPLMLEQPILPLDIQRFHPFWPQIEKASLGLLPADDIKHLRFGFVQAITGAKPSEPNFDSRVEAALHMIHTKRLEDVSLEIIARVVHLSPDRLRHLFRHEVGYTLSHYARTSAVWKALALWSEGEKLTNIALDAGFHDYSHFNHAFNEMFGFRPTFAIGVKNFRIIRCN